MMKKLRLLCVVTLTMVLASGSILSQPLISANELFKIYKF